MRAQLSNSVRRWTVFLSHTGRCGTSTTIESTSSLNEMKLSKDFKKRKTRFSSNSHSQDELPNRPHKRDCANAHHLLALDASIPFIMHGLPNRTCPLCGEPNECTPANVGTLDVECWCTNAKVSAASLARVPEPLRGKACLCASCASQEPSGSTKPEGE
jgi:hypothetical protein